MLLHEISHFFIAKRLGYYPSKIHLSFFGARLEGEDDFLVSDEIKIVASGPFFNFLVIVCCYLSFWFYPEAYVYLYDVLIANYALLIFNCLPVYPLDMGRLLLAILSIKKDRLKSLAIMKRFSFAIIAIMFVFYVVTFVYLKNFTFGFVCVNLMFLCFSSARDTSYKRQLFVWRKFEKLSKGLPEKKIYVSASKPLYSLYKFIDNSHFVNFVFLGDDYSVKNKMTEIDLYRKFGMIEWILL